MTYNFELLDYHLPTEPARHYSQQAIAVLQAVKQQYPDFYKQLRSPSEVLTLSGVRAYDTYYDLGHAADPASIAGLKELLLQHDVLLLEETLPVIGEDNPNHNYSLVHRQALLDIPNRYRRTDAVNWLEPQFEAIITGQDCFLWQLLWRDKLNVAEWQRDERLWTDWMLNDGTMIAHDLTVGMLLGYPGEAICCSLYQTDSDDQKGRVLWADVKYAAAFDGAQPRYTYFSDVADRPAITQHVQLWSDILDDVYRELEPDVARSV